MHLLWTHNYLCANSNRYVSCGCVGTHFVTWWIQFCGGICCITLLIYLMTQCKLTVYGNWLCGKSFKSPVVAICATNLALTKSVLCPHSVFMCFVWIWEQTGIMSLYSINWLVFITERESVYCTVRTGYIEFYVLPTQLYLCVLCGSENKQGLCPYTALTDWFL